MRHALCVLGFQFTLPNETCPVLILEIKVLPTIILQGSDRTAVVVRLKVSKNPPSRVQRDSQPLVFIAHPYYQLFFSLSIFHQR